MSEKVRVLINNKIPWFVAKDVAKRLEFKYPGSAISTLVDDSNKRVVSVKTDDGWEPVTVVNEYGLCNLVMGISELELTPKEVFYELSELFKIESLEILEYAQVPLFVKSLMNLLAKVEKIEKPWPGIDEWEGFEFVEIAW